MHESEPYEEVSDFSLCMKVYRMKKFKIVRNLLYLTAWRVQDLHFATFCTSRRGASNICISQPFVPHDVARPRFAFLVVSRMNVDFCY